MSIKKQVTWEGGEKKTKVVLRSGAPVDMTDVNVMAPTHGVKYLCRIDFAAIQSWE